MDETSTSSSVPWDICVGAVKSDVDSRFLYHEHSLRRIIASTRIKFSTETLSSPQLNYAGGRTAAYLFIRL